MKLPILLFVLSTTVLAAHKRAHAQAANYQPIRGDAGLIGTYAPSNGRGGFGAMGELLYSIHDHVAIGGRIEAAVEFGGNIDAGGDVALDLGAVGAFLAKGEYYLTTTTIRPFVGLSLGVYDIASESITTTQSTASVDQKAGRYFGVAPQVGIELGRVRLAATYNAILGADIEVHQTAGNGAPTRSYSQNYFGFELSFRFGGARRVTADRSELQ